MSSSSRTSSDMSTLTASLERSLQNFSLNHHHHHNDTTVTDFIGGYGSSSTSTDESSPGRIENHLYSHRRGRRVHPCLSSSSSSSASSSAAKLSDANTLLELNSHISMPYHWEQCLDLKTGEVYYINWRTGMKAKEDPRLSSTSPPSLYNTANYSDDHYYSDEDDSDEEVESEGSSTEYSSPTSHQNYRPSSATGKTTTLNKLTSGKKSGKSCCPEDVLVVAGCKSCMMYYMVPKNVNDCPKCTAHLLHFDDRSVDHSI